MAALVSIPELGVWCRQEIGYDDEFAVAILEAASEVVRSAARHAEWTAKTVPARAKQICAHLAARSYLNPDSVVGEGSIGPLGGDRYVEALATALHLTAAEREELETMASAGSARGSLWIQPVGSNTLESPEDVYLPDHSGSDWMIPYLAPDDVRALG